MRWRTPVTLIAIVAPALPCSGCIEYVIESPHHSVVLARGGGERIAEVAKQDGPPILRQRQFGLISGLFFLSDEKFSEAMKGNELKGAGIVTGLHFSDILLETVTRFHPLGSLFSIVTSRTVRVYIDVQ